MVVRGRELVKQASKRLTQESVPHVVHMAGHKGGKEIIKICSIDTLRARNLSPTANVIIIDEAHLATSPSYHWLVSKYPNAFYIPVTATPYTQKSLSHLAETIVSPIDYDGLVELGHLVPIKYFSTPILPNLERLKLTKGEWGSDYKTSDIERIMSQKAIMSDMVKTWLKRAEGRPTIVFCSSRAHAKSVQERFNSAGIPAAYVDGETPDEQRQTIFDDLEMGLFSVVCNINVLSIGVDLPFISCVLLARPTQSLNLHIQQIGRGSRPYYGKKDLIVLDHTGNVLRHGFVNRKHKVNLEEERFKRATVPVCKQCLNCFVIYDGDKCHYCGWSPPKKDRDPNMVEIDGELIELREDLGEDSTEILVMQSKLKKIAKAKGYHHGWVYHQIKQKYGQRMALKLYPGRNIYAKR